MESQVGWKGPGGFAAMPSSAAAMSSGESWPDQGSPGALEGDAPDTPSGFATVGSSTCEGGFCTRSSAAARGCARLAAAATAAVIWVKRRRVSGRLIADNPLLKTVGGRNSG